MTGSDPGDGRPRSADQRSTAKVNKREVTPLERLAKRVCHAANASGTSEVGAVLAEFKRRSNMTVVTAAVELAVAKQWLRFDGTAYFLTQVGAELGSQSRRGSRTRRLMPF